MTPSSVQNTAASAFQDTLASAWYRLGIGSIFETIEDKIIAELNSYIPYVETVDSYAGQLDQDLKSMPMKLPAIFVSYGGSTFEWIDGPNHRETVDFSILVAAKNARGEKSARKAAYGCYQMINDVLVVLTNMDFGLDIEKLVPKRTSLIFAGRTIVVYGIDFQASFDTTFNWD